MSPATIASGKHRSAAALNGTRLQKNALPRRKKKLFTSSKMAASLPPKTQAKAVQVNTVRRLFGVSQEEFSRITGYSIRAIAGWEAGRKLSQAARQKLMETDRLRAVLAEIVPSSQLGMWMRTPNPAFEGRSPIQVIERGETDRIWRMIIQIDAGVAN
jgi:DNA-binding transcriptional regulator YiaG